jgi:hypothetical protein
LSVVALMAAASFGLTARILTCGKRGALLPGLIDIGALAAAVAGIGPDDIGIECDCAAGAASDVAWAAACCAGWLLARTYQHLR